MKTIAASVLIAELSAYPTPVLNTLIDSIKAEQAKALVGYTLQIIIDTDDDFLVNGSANFSANYPIHGDAKTAIKHVIDSLVFTNRKSTNNTTKISLEALVSGDSFHDKNYKINDFKKRINSNSLINYLIEDGSVSMGGNQTFQAHIIAPVSSLKLGDLTIDLKG